MPLLAIRGHIIRRSKLKRCFSNWLLAIADLLTRALRWELLRAFRINQSLRFVRNMDWACRDMHWACVPQFFRNRARGDLRVCPPSSFVSCLCRD